LWYGGAGALFAGFVADEVGVKANYVAPHSSVFSAAGMLGGEVTFRSTRSFVIGADEARERITAIGQVFDDLDDRVLRQAGAEGYRDDEIQLRHTVAARFTTQHHQLSIDASSGDVDAEEFDELERRFRRRYEQIYGVGSIYSRATVEFASLTATGRVELNGTTLGTRRAKWEPNAGKAVVNRRSVRFPAGEEAVEIPVHRFEAGIPSGYEIAGPAIIERPGDTIVIPPSLLAVANEYGILTVSRSP
jgi:N-methylhydantoinase A